MDFNYFLVLIPLLGLIFGCILAKIAKEEVKMGGRYFLIFRRLILFILVIGLLFLAPFSVNSLVGFLVGFGVSFLLRWRYLYLGLAVFASFQGSVEFLVFMVSMAFIYGLPFGSQMNGKAYLNSIFRCFVLYLIPFVLLFVPFSVGSILPAFAAGTLFLRE